MERRTCWSVILCLVLVLIMSVMGFMHLKRELVNKLTNEVEFIETAVREADQGIQNYNMALAHSQTELDNADKEIKELTNEVGKLNSEQQQKDTEVKGCTDSKAGISNDIAAVEKDNTDTNANFAGEKTKFEEEINGLKKQLEMKSILCGYVQKKFEEEPTVKELCPIQPAIASQ